MKNETILDPKSIKNIKLVTPFLYSFFNVNRVIIETNIVGDNSEIIINMISKDDANTIVNNLRPDNNSFKSNIQKNPSTEKEFVESDNIIYKIKNNDILILSIFSQSFFAFLYFSISLYFFIDDNMISNNLFKDIFTFKTIMKINPFLLMVIIIFFILVYNLIYNYMKFYNFTLKKIYSDFTISSGIIEKKTDNLYIADIDIIYTYSNVIMRCFKLLQAKVIMFSDITLSNGNNDKEKILFPIINQSFFRKFINEQLHDFFQSESKNINNSFFLITLYNILIMTIIGIGIYAEFIYVKNVIILAITIIISILVIRNIFLNSYTRVSIPCDLGLIIIQRFFINSETYFIKPNRIIEYYISQNFIQKSFKLCTIEITIREKMNKKLKIRFINKLAAKNLEEILNNNKNL